MKIKSNSMTAGVSLTLAVALTAACGKKSSGSDDKSGTNTNSTPGVTNKTDNDLVVTGQLAISTMALTDAPKGVLAFTSRNGEYRGQPQVIDVDANGNFSVPIKRNEDAVKVLVEEAGKPRDQRNWERMYQALRDAFPDQGSQMTLEQIKNEDEAKIQSGVGELANKAKNDGSVTMLVAYDKTGDKVTEAASFRFISLPTPENKPLSALPNERLKGDVGLGKITGSNRDVTSETKSKDALELSDGAMESLADAGRALKNVINSYMNTGWKAQPFYYWETTQKVADAIDKFSDPGVTKYRGYGFYIGSEGSQGLNKAAVCSSGKAITFTPPAPITVVNQSGQPSTPVTEYNNNGTTPKSDDSTACYNSGGYYAREDNRDGQYSYMLNFGTGGSITSSPKGLWRLKVDGSEVARFDFDTSSPMVDGNPVVPVPRVKYTTANGMITGVEVELYRWSPNGFVKIEDLGGFKRVVSYLRAGYTKNGDFETKLTIGDDGKITGVFDGKDADKGTVRNPSVAASDVTALAVYYVIGNASYRLELR